MRVPHLELSLVVDLNLSHWFTCFRQPKIKIGAQLCFPVIEATCIILKRMRTYYMRIYYIQYDRHIINWSEVYTQLHTHKLDTTCTHHVHVLKCMPFISMRRHQTLSRRGNLFVVHVYLFDIAMFDHPSVEQTSDW